MDDKTVISYDDIIKAAEMMNAQAIPEPRVIIYEGCFYVDGVLQPNGLEEDKPNE